ncbi:MAG: response regulator [Lachnospiraceae bacterium]|nr:response regulator [Lachnospiraceae bacterium]
MKKVFIIGMFEDRNDGLDKVIQKKYMVQKCISNSGLIVNMLNMHNPDLAIVSLFGLENDGDRIFSEIKRNHSEMPVVVIGDVSEQYQFSRYLSEDNFHRLTNPVSNEEIFNAVKERLENNGAGKKIKSKNTNKKKVLLVDDNPTQLRMLNDVLNSKYDVQMVTSGMKAISILEKFMADVILLDYEMPMCDGKMTLEMIRGIDEYKDIPVVFLTGMADKEHIQAVFDLKPAGYLLKTTSTDRIFDKLEEIFEE